MQVGPKRTATVFWALGSGKDKVSQGTEMPLLYLHQINHGERVEDVDGAEFEDLNAAREEAIQSAREMMADRLKQGRYLDHSFFEIVDESGAVLLTLPFSEAIPESSEKTA